MAFTAEQLAQLEKAAASGQRRVQLGDKVIEYQSLPDLLEAIRAARADQSSSGYNPLRYSVGTFTDG